MAAEVVYLASAGDLQEAHAWRTILAREGIHCQVVGEFLTGGFGLGLLPNMYPEIWVKGEDFGKARFFLEQATEKH